ncbi:hypothetical protein V8F33_007128 [Rhypophila sp. PSN 637]
MEERVGWMQAEVEHLKGGAVRGGAEEQMVPRRANPSPHSVNSTSPVLSNSTARRHRGVISLVESTRDDPPVTTYNQPAKSHSWTVPDLQSEFVTTRTGQVKNTSTRWIRERKTTEPQGPQQTFRRSVGCYVGKYLFVAYMLYRAAHDSWLLTANHGTEMRELLTPAGSREIQLDWRTREPLTREGRNRCVWSAQAWNGGSDIAKHSSMAGDPRIEDYPDFDSAVPSLHWRASVPLPGPEEAADGAEYSLRPFRESPPTSRISIWCSSSTHLAAGLLLCGPITWARNPQGDDALLLVGLGGRRTYRYSSDKLLDRSILSEIWTRNLCELRLPNALPVMASSEYTLFPSAVSGDSPESRQIHETITLNLRENNAQEVFKNLTPTWACRYMDIRTHLWSDLNLISWDRARRLETSEDTPSPLISNSESGGKRESDTTKAPSGSRSGRNPRGQSECKNDEKNENAGVDPLTRTAG